MTTEVLRVNRSCAIPYGELMWQFGTSGGAGGQHANRARTRVEVSFDISLSPSLTDAQRRRLQTQLGNVARAVAGEERSQARNRVIALERLRSRLAGALHEDRPRRPTRPSAGGRRRRLDSKRRRAGVKRDRRKPGADEG